MITFGGISLGVGGRRRNTFVRGRFPSGGVGHTGADEVRS
jgi:hypothetical protein